ncbi:MAG: 2,3-bisphosphoglycerate-independent phosphoglycerate mutase [Terracidiphilus sp.]|nr:2,3-bisphosphoglycerate-independent phosphoglycerate mutase [Terracidiphilus sp.]
MATKRPVVLTILDGWGYRPQTENNAIALATKPTYDTLLREYPNTLIQASEQFVGLPGGQMGNSEVGHLNIGAGRIVQMDITRIDCMVADNTLKDNEQIKASFEHARKSGRALHLLGLVSDGGVHSHQEHLYAILRAAKQAGLERVFVHAYLDGRDTPPSSGADYVAKLEQKMREYGIGKVATVSGRYYAMDRDKRWERQKKAFDAMVTGKAEGGTATSAVDAIKASYNANVNDEFVLPTVIVDATGQPVGLIKSEDAVLNFNYRADRARQVTRVLCRESGINAEGGRNLDQWEELDKAIPRNTIPKNLHYTCMTQYDEKFQLPIVSPPQLMSHILGNVLGDAGLRNLRTAETEKYAHVTFFFNGGREKPFAGEERILTQSPKVATYDLQPEMSSVAVGDSIVKAINDTAFDVIISNFANPDMVGHTGILPAAIKAVQAVDLQLARIYKAVREKNAIWLVTADHGNCETMVDPITGEPHTAHTTNPVPFIYVADDAKNFRLRNDGSLRDIAPTILGALPLGLPAEMSGRDMRIPIVK